MYLALNTYLDLDRYEKLSLAEKLTMIKDHTIENTYTFTKNNQFYNHIAAWQSKAQGQAFEQAVNGDSADEYQIHNWDRVDLETFDESTRSEYLQNEYNDQLADIDFQTQFLVVPLNNLIEQAVLSAFHPQTKPLGTRPLPTGQLSLF